MGNTVKTLKNTFNKINPWAEDDGDDCDEYVDPTDITEDIPPFRLVLRKDLNLKKPRWRLRLKTPVDNYMLRYFTNTPQCKDDEECGATIRQLQESHKSLGLPDIAFNFLVSDDGTVYEGRGWHTKSSKLDWQSVKHHGKTIDIAYIGDYKYSYPTDEMQRSVCSLMRTGVNLGMVNEGYDVFEYRDDIPTGYWDREAMEDDHDEKLYEDCEPEPDQQTPSDMTKQ